MKLPKLYAPVLIKFVSFRTRYTYDLGAYESDEHVVRKCRRVLSNDNSWKWQIVGYKELVKFDCTVETDREMLDVHGSWLEFELI